MGFFNFGNSSDNTIADEKEAFFAIIFACIAADGSIEDEEINNLITVVSNKTMFRNFAVTPTFHAMARLHKNLGGSEALVKLAAPMISNRLKATAFATAVDFALADGSVGHEEERLIYTLKDALGIDDSLAKNIVDVIVIKNQN